MLTASLAPSRWQESKEFQRTNRLRANGIVGPVTWRKLQPGAPIPKPTFYVEGRYLHDPRGNKVILRGVNKMSVWDGADPTGASYFPEIRQTGANSVRIVWTITNRGAPHRPGDPRCADHQRQAKSSDPDD